MVSVRRSLAWMSLGQGSLFVLQFGVMVVVARLLTPYDMGVFAVAVAIVGLLSTIRSLGLQGYIVRAPELAPPLVATVFTINAALAVLVALAIAGVAELGGALLGNSSVQRLLLAMVVVPLLNIFEILPGAYIERRGDFRSVALINVARYGTANLAVLGFALAGHSYMSLAYGQIISAVVSMAMTNAIGWRHVSLRLGLHQWREVTRYGTQMLTISGVNLLANRVSEIVLGRVLGLEALGLYTRASSVTGMLWENLHVVLMRVLFVDFAEQRRQGRSLREPYLGIVGNLTAVLWPMLIGLAVVSGPAVTLLYGPNWTASALPLSILCVSMALWVPMAMTGEILVVCHETARQSRYELIRAPVGLLLFTVGCFVSIVAAAAARLLETVFTILLYRSHVERLTETRWADYVPILSRSGFLTGVAVLPAAMVMAAHGWAATTPIAPVMAAIGVGILGWLVALRALRHPLFDEGLRLLARFRPA